MSVETYNGIEYQCSDVYSDKDMTGHDLSGREDMSGIVIHGLCLSNETPNAQVLPASLTGATFLLCNLDNVFIPPGNTLIACSNRLFKAQDDGEDWIIDPNTLLPLSPLNPQDLSNVGLNTSAQYLLKTKQAIPLVQQAAIDINAADAAAQQAAINSLQGSIIIQQDLGNVS